MRSVVLVGAGQMGRAALRMINRTNCTVSAFADNNKNIWGSTLCGLPVLSVEEAVKGNPDGILIAVAGQERTEQLRHQLQELGYTGEIRALAEYAETMDIRGGVFELLADRLEKIPGDFAELGVYQGEFAARINSRFPERTLYLFDTFEGFDARDMAAETGYSRAATGDFDDTSVELVLSKLCAPEKAVIRKGYFPETAEGLEAKFAFVSLDADLYEPTYNGLEWFYPRMVSGGVLLLHDYESARFSGVRAAVDAYEQAYGRLLLLPVGDLHGSVMVIHP